LFLYINYGINPKKTQVATEHDKNKIFSPSAARVPGLLPLLQAKLPLAKTGGFRVRFLPVFRLDFCPFFRYN
jgi:hypothetical protein